MMNNQMYREIKAKYKIYFGSGDGEIPEQNENALQWNDVKIENYFDYNVFKSKPTIKDLKEFFLTNFGEKNQYCKCQLSVLFKEDNEYQLLSNDENTELNHDELYLIKSNNECNCEFKCYKKYMNISKFDAISQLKSEIEKISKTEEIKRNVDANVEDFYDIVININSIKNVNKQGWAIKYNEEGYNKYKKFKEQELLTIGVLGNTNKGKSFLLSKISKIKLLTGTSINTEGISVKYPDVKDHKGRQIILLDSAGLETPVLNKIDNEKNLENIDQNIKEEENKEENNNETEQNKEFKEKARDKIMTELFLQNLIIKFSDILLVVVGKLTYSEQLLINKIKIASKNQNKDRFVIIHNLQEFRVKEQVEKYIKETLLKCSTFNLKKRNYITTKENQEEENDKKKEDNIGDNNVDHEEKLNDIHFTEIVNYGSNQKLEIFHLILANEDSEAGIIYNQYAYNFIENIYNLISNRKKFDVFQQVQDVFKKESRSYLIDNIQEKELKYDEKVMKLDFEGDLQLKKCFTDELGFSLFKTGNFEPKFNYFKPDKDTLEIRLEIPGNVKIEVIHKVEGDETIVVVKGTKKRDTQPKNKKDVLHDIREFSDFELYIPLKVEQFKIKAEKPKEGYPKFVNGICLIQYELTSEGAAAEGQAISEEL